MTPRRIRSVGSMSLADFDRFCRGSVLKMAFGIREDAKTARVRSKTSYAGVAGGDVVTDADLKAQARFLALAQQSLPKEVGLIGEENGLRRPSTLPGHAVTITVDPVDGTRALIRAVQKGRLPLPGEVSAMLGIQVDGEAVGAYVCDVGSLATYVRPIYGPRVLYVTSNGTEIDTSVLPRATTMAEATLLRQGSRPIGTSLGKRLVSSAFGRVQPVDKSIGLTVADVISGRAAAALRVAGTYITPWDDTPVQAMCGGNVVVLRMTNDRLEELRFDRLDKLMQYDHDILYIARRYLPELRKYAPVTTFS